MKKIIERNLPLDKTYRLISSRYAGIEEGCCCDNCNRPIANIAVIEDSDNKVYSVGLDCAETLSGIKDDFAFNYVHKSAFDSAKQFRSKLLQNAKKYDVAGMSTFVIDSHSFLDVNNKEQYIIERWCVYPTGRRDLLGYSFHQIDAYQNYVYPMIKDLLTKYPYSK
jgi:hypothetical protein